MTPSITAQHAQRTTVRPRELGTLLDTVHEAGSGRFAAVELTGGPGTGKTTLLTESCRAASRQGLRVLRAGCSEARRSAPFHPFLQAFTTWSAAGTTPSVTALAALLAADDDTGPDDFARRHFRIAEIRRALTECLFDAPAGVLLVLDDCHWADPSSTELLQSLIRWPIAGGLGLIVAYRPRQAPAELRTALRYGVEEGTTAAVALPALTVRQSAELLGADPEDPELIRLHRRSGGNPLRLTAFALLESTDDPADAWDRHGLGARMTAETALLDDRSRLLANAAAILDETFDVDTVATIARTPHENACAGLGELRRRELIQPAGPGLFAFRDPLLRLWVYSSIDPCWRAAAHHRALTYLSARGVPATDLAPHVERAGPAAGPGDLRILTSATRTAAHLGRITDATRWLSTALRIQRTAGTAPEAIGPELWRPVLQALVAAGEAGRVAALAHDVLSSTVAGPAASRLPVVTLFSSALAALGRADEADAFVAAELGVHGTADPAATAALRVLQQLVKVLSGQMPARTDVEALVRLVPDAEPLTAAAALALCGLCAVADGDIRTADRALTGAAAMLDTTDPGSPAGDQECVLLLVVSWAEALIARYGAATGHAERALTAVRQRGDAHLLTPLLNTLAYAHYQCGRMADALQLAQEGRTHARGAGRQDHEGFSDAITAAAWAQLGHTAARSARPPQATPMSAPRTPLNALLMAESYLAAGDGEAALALLLPRRNALRVVEPVAVLAPRGYELLAAAALSSGIRRDSIADWAAQAAAAAAAVGLQEPKGHAVLARGHLLVSRRMPAEAASCYAQAHELLGGASPAGARARELARTTAAAPARDALGDLTSREREVAQLAGDGRRSKEIAERLRVSNRTVDAHLSRIYHKLGVTSRAELARLVARGH